MALALERRSSYRSIDPFANQLTGLKFEKSQIKDALLIAAKVGFACSVVAMTARAIDHASNLDIKEAVAHSYHTAGLAAWTAITEDIHNMVAGRRTWLEKSIR